jgi:hypothetical protein
VKICTEYREFFWYFWLVGLSPGLGPINKNYQIGEISRKSQKILNPRFMSERLLKLSSLCFGLASSLEV